MRANNERDCPPCPVVTTRVWTQAELRADAAQFRIVDGRKRDAIHHVPTLRKVPVGAAITPVQWW